MSGTDSPLHSSVIVIIGLLFPETQVDTLSSRSHKTGNLKGPKDSQGSLHWYRSLCSDEHEKRRLGNSVERYHGQRSGEVDRRRDGRYQSGTTIRGPHRKDPFQRDPGSGSRHTGQDPNSRFRCDAYRARSVSENSFVEKEKTLSGTRGVPGGTSESPVCPRLR